MLSLQFYFENPSFSPKPKLQRQDKLFSKHKGKVLRPFELNTNIAAWSRLLKQKKVPQVPTDELSLSVQETAPPPPPPARAAALLEQELKRLSRDGSLENVAPPRSPEKKSSASSTSSSPRKSPKSSTASSENGHSSAEKAAKALSAFSLSAQEVHMQLYSQQTLCTLFHEPAYP